MAAAGMDEASTGGEAIRLPGSPMERKTASEALRQMLAV